MILPLLGFMTEVRSELKEFAQGVLLVAGGYLIGFLASGLVLWVFDKRVFSQKSPEFLSKFGRHLGGAICALIVALLVFTGKGKPDGAGGDGKGAVANSSGPGDKPVSNPEAPTKPDQKQDASPVPIVKPGQIILRVTVYGGTVVSGEQFYQFENERQRKTLDEIKTLILDRKAIADGKLTVAILLPADLNESPTGQNLSVTNLEDWLRKVAGVDVVLPATPK